MNIKKLILCWGIIGSIGYGVGHVFPLASAQTSISGGVPQKALPKEKLVIVDHAQHKHEFMVELAITPEQQQKGEMFRASIPEDSGMLFVWPIPQQSQMWMKNTQIPLDMIFISPEGKIISIAENTVPYSLRQIDSHGIVKATLEVKAGTAARLGLQRGDTVSSPSLKESALPVTLQQKGLKPSIENHK